MINREQIEANWDLISGGIRSIWGKVTEGEIHEAKSNLPKLCQIIQNRYGDSTEEIEKRLQQLADSYNNPTDRYGQKDVSSYERSPLIDDQLYL